MFVKELKSFVRREDGAVTVETILWVNFMLFFVLAIADLCIFFMNYGNAVRIIHEDNRAFAVGEVKSCTDLETRMNANLQVAIPSAQASCTVASPLTTVSVTLGSGDMGLGVISSMLNDVTVSTSAIQSLEYIPGT